MLSKLSQPFFWNWNPLELEYLMEGREREKGRRVWEAISYEFYDFWFGSTSNRVQANHMCTSDQRLHSDPCGSFIRLDLSVADLTWSHWRGLLWKSISCLLRWQRLRVYSEYLFEKPKSQKGLIFFTESSASFCLWGFPAGQIYSRQCPR